jgi:hypothetical protein
MDKDKQLLIAKLMRGMMSPPGGVPAGGGVGLGESGGGGPMSGLMDAGVDVLQYQADKKERERLAKMMGNQ